MNVLVIVFLALALVVNIPYASGCDDYLEIDSDKPEHEYGEVMPIIGCVYNPKADQPVVLEIWEFWQNKFVTSVNILPDENGNFIYEIDTTDSNWKLQTEYEFIAKYQGHTDSIRLRIELTPQQDALRDHTRPLIVVPDNLIVTSSSPIVVDFSVKGVDNMDGIVAVTCDPHSGSIFPLGKTKVECMAKDSSGNTQIKSFTVTIQDGMLNIPNWLEQVTEFWINDEINDDGFVQVIQYLVEHEIIIIPNATPAGEQAATQIPSWIKTNAEFWVNGQISDQEFATGIEWLINNGIITV